MAIRSVKSINHTVFKYYLDKLNASKYSAVIQGSVATAHARPAQVHKLAIHTNNYKPSTHLYGGHNTICN